MSDHEHGTRFVTVEQRERDPILRALEGGLDCTACGVAIEIGQDFTTLDGAVVHVDCALDEPYAGGAN